MKGSDLMDLEAGSLLANILYALVGAGAFISLCLLLKKELSEIKEK